MPGQVQPREMRVGRGNPGEFDIAPLCPHASTRRFGRGELEPLGEA